MDLYYLKDTVYFSENGCKGQQKYRKKIISNVVEWLEMKNKTNSQKYKD